MKFYLLLNFDFSSGKVASSILAYYTKKSSSMEELFMREATYLHINKEDEFV